MVFAQVLSFFVLVCTSSQGIISQECVEWVYNCWIEQLEDGKDVWFGAEVCSEMVDPDMVKFR